MAGRAADDIKRMRLAALRRREAKREDAQVDMPKTLKGVHDRWHLYRVVA